MRYLTREELPILEDNGESGEGCVGIESTTSESADMHIGTLCGIEGNECFIEIAKEFPNRKVRGWFDKKENVILGMVHIECTEDETETIENLAKCGNGSLRENGTSTWEGFYEFEIE